MENWTMKEDLHNRSQWFKICYSDSKIGYSNSTFVALGDVNFTGEWKTKQWKKISKIGCSDSKFIILRDINFTEQKTMQWKKISKIG